MYLSYEDYQNMGGTLDETAFNNFEFEAECMVNYYTFNRLKKIDEAYYPDTLDRCVFKLIELAKLKADMLALGKQTTLTVDGDGKNSVSETSAYISSQANDGVSVSYNTIDAGSLFNMLWSSNKADGTNPIESTINMYLDDARDMKGRRLLYRGVYGDE